MVKGTIVKNKHDLHNSNSNSSNNHNSTSRPKLLGIGLDISSNPTRMMGSLLGVS